MECLNDDRALDLLYMGLVLIVFALAGLIYTAVNARRSVLGGMLLKACAGDWQTAALAVENVKAETELLVEALKSPPRNDNKGHTLQ